MQNETLASPATAPALSPEERREFLLDRLRADGRLVAADAARALHTSEDTIRRDLRGLAASGLCQRVHGGALPPRAALTPFAERTRRSPIPDALAAAAAALVGDGATVLVDGGTANLAVAQRLSPDLRGVTVVTPSPAVAVALAEHPGVEVILVGGRLDKAEMVTAGCAAVEAVGRVRADLCLLGVCALDAGAGIGAGGYEDAHLKRAMIGAAAETAAVVVGAKLGTTAPHVVAPASALGRIVVERAAPESALAPLAALGLAITRA